MPDKPGVYFFFDSKGEIIYIGKSSNLKNRLRSYFNLKNLLPKTLAMVNEAARVTWQKTESEIEALINESLLIKKNKPRYNIASGFRSPQIRDFVL
ncbi:MAG: excinuclease ABC subunit C [Parcubacteria group bacterium Licking1014_17]|nr:MAG: excinuclease ABC subunit C [Parcubacteria group bacterium Licking1014_17]